MNRTSKIFSLIVAAAAAVVLVAGCGASKGAASSAAKNSFPAVRQGGKTAIVAHRGFWNCAAAGFAENSIASLKAAQDNGFWGSEFDIHLTSDNVVVVHHDRDISSRDIQTNTYDSFSADRLKNGEKVPTLDEYLDQGVKSDKTMLIVELKKQYSQEREDILVDLTLKSIKAHGLYDPSRVAFISFSHHICQVLAKQCPEFVNQYLNGELSPEQLAAEGINGFDYERKVVFKDSSMVARAHALGMSTNTWTVNKAHDMQRMIDLGINAITTNEPLLLRSLLEKKEYRNK